MQRRPAEPRSDRGPIILALNHELRAALVEAKDFVSEVETIHDEVQAAGQADAALRINLQVRVEVAVPEGARRAIAVEGDVGLVIGEAHTH